MTYIDSTHYNNIICGIYRFVTKISESMEVIEKNKTSTYSTVALIIANPWQEP